MLSWVDGGPSPLLFCYTLMAYRESQSGQFRKSRWNLESEAASFNFWLEIQRFSCLFSVKWNHSEHPKLQEKGELIVGSSQITDWSQTAQQAAPMPGICCQDSVDQFCLVIWWIPFGNYSCNLAFTKIPLTLCLCCWWGESSVLKNVSPRLAWLPV